MLVLVRAETSAREPATIPASLAFILNAFRFEATRSAAVARSIPSAAAAARVPGMAPAICFTLSPARARLVIASPASEAENTVLDPIVLASCRREAVAFPEVSSVTARRFAIDWLNFIPSRIMKPKPAVTGSMAVAIWPSPPAIWEAPAPIPLNRFWSVPAIRPIRAIPRDAPLSTKVRMAARPNFFKVHLPPGRRRVT